MAALWPESDPLSTMLAALVLFDEAYLAKIAHAGLQSLPKEQRDADLAGHHQS